MDSDEAKMMRSSTLSHRTAGGAGGGQKNHHSVDVENSSPRGSREVSPTHHGHTASATRSSNITLPTITTTTTAASSRRHGSTTNDKQRRQALRLLQRLRLVVLHRNVYISGIVAIMLIVFWSSMSQLREQSSSSSSSSFRYIYYTPATAVYPSSVTLVKLPDNAGLPIPHLPHMYKTESTNSNATTGSTIQSWKPNYGGLNVRMIPDDDVPRTVFRNGDDLRNSYLSKGDGDDKVSWYYLTDDVVQRNPTLQFDDDAFVAEHKDNPQECRLNAWEHVVYENCNTFHELDFQGLMLQDKSLAIGAGYYRDVFKTETHFGETLVLKENSYENAHGSYNFKDFHFVRKDGIVSAAIQPHPLIVDTYGFCALSFFTELMPYGDVAKYAVPIFERCDDEDEEEEEKEEEKKGRDSKPVKKPKKKKFTWQDHTSRGRLIPMNNLTATTKLVWALEMAESIALLNNHQHGVIVHDDVQLVQWLVTEDHEHLKLNDFNRAEVMLYDETNQEYCKYRNNPGNGDWRAPEEYYDYPLDESIDIWSLGNNFYSLLTGLPPFPEECHVKGLQKRIKKKETSWIDPKWKSASFAEGVLVHVIQRCWEYKPEDRITIGALVQLLRAAVEENKTKKHPPPLSPAATPSRRRLPPPRPRDKQKTRQRPTANTTAPLMRVKEASSRRQRQNP